YSPDVVRIFLLSGLNVVYCPHTCRRIFPSRTRDTTVVGQGYHPASSNMPARVGLRWGGRILGWLPGVSAPPGCPDARMECRLCVWAWSLPSGLNTSLLSRGFALARSSAISRRSKAKSGCNLPVVLFQYSVGA